MELKKKGDKWKDSGFPAQMSSICPGADWKDKYDEIQWNRANKIPYVTNDETQLVLFTNDM